MEWNWLPTCFLTTNKIIPKTSTYDNINTERVLKTKKTVVVKNTVMLRNNVRDLLIRFFYFEQMVARGRRMESSIDHRTLNPKIITFYDILYNNWYKICLTTMFGKNKITLIFENNVRSILHDNSYQLY